MTSTQTSPRRGALPFRSHDTLPAHVTSPLFSSLIEEWIGLNSSRSIATEIERWSRLEPALAGHSWPADIVDAIDAAENEVKDAMLASLLRLAQDGHQLAGRILLQQMLPSISKLTKCSAPAPWAEDRRHIAVAEFWDLISRLNLEHHTHGIATTLHMRMVGRVFGRSSTRVEPAFPVGCAEEVWEAAAAHPAVRAHDDDTPTAAEVLEWGVANQTITSAEAELLTYVYIGEHTATEAAAHFQLTPPQTRQRCSRACRRLAAVAPDFWKVA